jgi:Ni/Co efflux regulator RcnB
MNRLMTLIVATAFALTTGAAFAADAPKADDTKKPAATKDTGKKDAAPAKKKKESC